METVSCKSINSVMGTVYLIVLILFASCSNMKGGLYRSDFGNWLTLKRDSTFEYKDVISIAHDDLFVYAHGKFNQIGDTLFLNYSASNVDTLNYHGRMISYSLPKYVVKSGTGFVLRSDYGHVRQLRRW